VEYLIRNVCDRDLPELIALCGQHAAYEEVDYSANGKIEQLKNALFSKEPLFDCWVVTINDKLIGYTSFTFDFSTWDARVFLHLDCLYIEEVYRNCGIGQEIMKRLIEVAKHKGCTKVEWQTPVFNKRAIRFYTRMGGKSVLKRRFSIDTRRI